MTTPSNYDGGGTLFGYSTVAVGSAVASVGFSESGRLSVGGDSGDRSSTSLAPAVMLVMMFVKIAMWPSKDMIPILCKFVSA